MLRTALPKLLVTAPPGTALLDKKVNAHYHTTSFARNTGPSVQHSR